MNKSYFRNIVQSPSKSQFTLTDCHSTCTVTSNTGKMSSNSIAELDRVQFEPSRPPRKEEEEEDEEVEDSGDEPESDVTAEPPDAENEYYVGEWIVLFFYSTYIELSQMSSSRLLTGIRSGLERKMGLWVG